MTLWFLISLLCWYCVASDKRLSAHPFLIWNNNNDGGWELKRKDEIHKYYDTHEVSFLQIGAKILAQTPPTAQDHAICTCRLESGAGGSAVDDLVDVTSFRQHNGGGVAVPQSYSPQSYSASISPHYYNQYPSLYPAQAPTYWNLPVLTPTQYTATPYYGPTTETAPYQMVQYIPVQPNQAAAPQVLQPQIPVQPSAVEQS